MFRTVNANSKSDKTILEVFCTVWFCRKASDFEIFLKCTKPYNTKTQ